MDKLLCITAIAFLLMVLVDASPYAPRRQSQANSNEAEFEIDRSTGTGRVPPSDRYGNVNSNTRDDYYGGPGSLGVRGNSRTTVVPTWGRTTGMPARGKDGCRTYTNSAGLTCRDCVRKNGENEEECTGSRQVQ